jgi:hypothetical protein
MARQTKKEKALARLVGHLMNRTLVARYDSLNRAPTRRVTEIRTDLSETEQMFYAEKRVLAYAKCDNLYDNTALASILDTSIHLTIGQRGGTPLLTDAFVPSAPVVVVPTAMVAAAPAAPVAPFSPCGP